LIFFLASTAWLYGKYSGHGLIRFWIYRYSRHPQYLGYLIWSYSLTMLVTSFYHGRRGYLPEPGMPWLISSLILVCTALYEELTMVRKYGDAYLTYRKEVPFLLSLPKPATKMILYPIKSIIGKEYPEDGKEIIVIFIVYLVIFTLLSLPFTMYG
jgi:hypothetical protein